eukprot:43485-Eustigmatos_ZCMA.PRE.1
MELTDGHYQVEATYRLKSDLSTVRNYKEVFTTYEEALADFDKCPKAFQPEWEVFGVFIRD